jgi:ABC-type spermidine/putrescine transport system permease subunit II
MNNLKFFLFSLIGFVLPISLLAQSRDMAISNDEVAYASVFAGDLSLLLSIVIGLIATYFVFRAAKKMGGGLFGSILNYIAIGMVLVVIGTISIFLNNWFSGVCCVCC